MRVRVAVLVAAFLLLALPAVALGWHPLTVTGVCNENGVAWTATATQSEANNDVDFSYDANFAIVLDTFTLAGNPLHATYQGNEGPIYVRWSADHAVTSKGSIDPCPTPTPTQTPQPTPTPTATPVDPTPTPTPTATPVVTPTPTIPPCQTEDVACSTPTPTPTSTATPVVSPSSVVTPPPTSTSTTSGTNGADLRPIFLLFAVITALAMLLSPSRRSR